MQLKSKRSQRGSWSLTKNIPNHHKLYYFMDNPKFIKILAIVFFATFFGVAGANYRQNKAHNNYHRMEKYTAELQDLKLNLFQLQQSAYLIETSPPTSNAKADAYLKLEKLKQSIYHIQLHFQNNHSISQAKLLLGNKNSDLLGFLKLVESQINSQNRFPKSGAAKQQDNYLFWQKSNQTIIKIAAQIDVALADIAAAKAKAIREDMAARLTLVFASFLLVLVAGVMGVLLVFQNRVITRKFDEYLSQEQSINAQLNADLKQITQAANQVAESGTFDWQLPPLEAAGELADSLNRLIAQVKQLLQKVESEKEDKIFQTDKMASLGKMVAGVAHEINNPLNCIYGNLDHISNYTRDLLALIHTYQEEIPQPPAPITAQAENIELEFIQQDLPQMMEAMQVAAERVREIVMTLKNFSRVDEGVAQPVDLHKCLDSTLLILQNRIKQGFQIVRHYGNLPMIEGYPGLLSQVFINILSNSLDALEEKGPAQGVKEITITTSLLDEDAVEIRIADNGPGISGDAQDKMFKTFFTTKPQGVGTGLGLAIVRKIVVEKYGGTIACNSELDMGTEFAIALPVRQNPTGEIDEKK
ncbi:MAG: hypothetical protein Fur0025_09730 [Oscillatoriaceae cyanobacterium]